MPSLSPTMSQGNISKWRKKEGDKVSAGDVLADIETDKATMEMEAMEDGFVAKILKPEGAQNVVVGEPVMIMVESAEDVAAFASYSGSGAPAKAAAAAPPPPKPAAAAAAAAPKPAAAPAAPAAPKPKAAGSRVFASPLARKTAAAAGVSLEGMAGTGPDGRIIKADVADALARGGAAPRAAAQAPASGASALEAMFPEFIDFSLNNIKKVTAKRLQESKQTVPHFYLSVDVRMDRLMEVREKLKGSSDVKLTVNDFVVKAAARALMKVPEVNSAWMGDKIRRYSSVDISIAVQTEHGLMVPIVRAAERKGLAAISSDVKQLAAKAKEGKLQPSEFVGGTFTISNLGMLGVKSFAAIVNPPQAAILAVGATRPELVPSTNAQGYETARIMTVTMSCDHRVVDGAVGAQWLAAFKGFIEDPLTLML